MKTITLNTHDSSYNIYIGRDILKNIKKYLEIYDKILILSNKTIMPLYQEKIKNILSEYESRILFYSVLDGEKYKNVETISEIIGFMAENGFSRKSVVVSVGGGVVCDMGGFTASVYMRGIDFIQVPTSLLAQVDASIGGKTAVNHSAGKNIIGTFTQPKAVFVDIDFLKTLPHKEFLSGMGEIIKHGVIADNGYLEFLDKNAEKILNHDTDALTEMIEGSCIIKKNVVQSDEKETGVRAFLNLGHTYSHTIENIFRYEGISHGEGVAKGVIFQFLLGEELGYADKNERVKVKNIFEKYGIDCTPVYIPAEKFIEIMKRDKKNSFGKIKFVLKTKEGMKAENILEEVIQKINGKNHSRFVKAVIDIGTNSCRLFIAEVDNSKGQTEIIRKLYKETQITKLGRYINEDSSIKEEGMEIVTEIISKYKKTADDYGICEIKGFATSATREALNRDYFLKKIYDETKIEIKCISGDEEAELTFSGAISEFENKNIVLFDIGGGSTEIIYGNRNKTEFLKSFKAGAVRETEMFFKNDNFSQENIEKCRESLKQRFKETEFLKERDFELVGVAGTVTTNVSVKEKMEKYDTEKVHMYRLSKEDLEKNLELYLSMDLEKRKTIAGLQPQRADTVISGTIIILVIMEMLGKNEITVCECDNLEGGMVRL